MNRTTQGAKWNLVNTESKKRMREKKRCDWCLSDPIYIRYHDDEWGREVHTDQVLFEYLVLEGAQAGLSWLTILKRREGYRKAFYDFEIEKVAQMRESDVKRLLHFEGIIRHRGKIEAAIINARAVLEIQKEFGSLDKYIWSFVGKKAIVHQIKSIKEIPTRIPQSKVLSDDLKKRGFKFVGPTIIYAFMQAVGLVDDHIEACYLAKKRRKK